MKQEQFLTMAKQISQKSDHATHKIGCVVAKKNRVLGSGFNVMRTHPKSPHQYKSIHAEFMAALNANFELKGATVYVFRQHKSGAWAISKPCTACWNFLIECGAKEVVYSFEGSFKQEELR